MRRRFTSAKTLWKCRSSRRSSGWSTTLAKVLRNRAGVGDTGAGGSFRGRAGVSIQWINQRLYQWALILLRCRGDVKTPGSGFRLPSSRGTPDEIDLDIVLLEDER